MQQVRELMELGLFNVQDVALAQMAAEYAGTLEQLPLVTAWVSQWTQCGHVCLAVDTPFDELARDVELPELEIPDLKTWIQSIPQDHPFVGTGDRLTPLVIDHAQGLIYLHRWFSAEQRVVEAIQHRMESSIRALSAASTQQLEKHFPDPEQIAQKTAVEIALSSPFSIVTGGPGTGKTTTILKLIDLFVSSHADENVKIALCAPTGKAVSRMEESIRGQVADSGNPVLGKIFAFDASSPVATPATLHRLLGSNPVRGTCRHHQHNKLPYDLVVVDESSMMDLLLMNQLIHALRPDAQLILVGDKDQLPAVGSGTVFADLCSAAGLQRAVATLDKNWRAKEAPGIVALAKAMNEQQIDEAIALLQSNHENLQWFEKGCQLSEVVEEQALPAWKQLRGCQNAKDAFAQLGALQVLCAVRKGPYGVHSVNVLARQLLKETAAHYHGLPIMISANDPQLKLYNGDLGMILAEADGTLKAWFPEGGGYRSVDLSRLPAHSDVYAMTIHKSQGSEASEILMVLPNHESPIITCELLYTGVTRAKKKVHLVANEFILRAGLSRTVQRVSGITAALAG